MVKFQVTLHLLSVTISERKERREEERTHNRMVMANAGSPGCTLIFLLLNTTYYVITINETFLIHRYRVALSCYSFTFISCSSFVHRRCYRLACYKLSCAFVYCLPYSHLNITSLRTSTSLFYPLPYHRHQKEFLVPCECSINTS